MSEQEVQLFSLPEGVGFDLRDVVYTPEAPRQKEPFTIEGRVTLFGLPYIPLAWVMATITYPETWWEELLPIIGAPTARQIDMAALGKFKIVFPQGFIREGEFSMRIGTYLGPTAALDSIVLPPAPSVATYDTVFTVSGGISEEEMFQSFRILGYSKGSETMVTPNNPLNLNVGDVCRVHIGFNYKGAPLTKGFYAALWKWSLLDPHDEVASANKVFNIPMSTEQKPYQNYIDIPITSGIAPGNYGLYAKEYTPFPDIITEYLPEGVIVIIGGGVVKISSITPNVAGVITDKVQAGETISAEVVWENTGGAAISPSFRWDLRRSGIATWNEGPWVSSPSVAPGATGTVNPYCKVPSDWGAGTTIDCKLMVKGVGQVWQEDDIFTVYKLEGIFELSSVTPNVNGVITDKVQAGDTISAKVIWKNVGTAAIAPRFRWDLRRSGWATWNEGPWVSSPSVAPGATGTVNPYCKVPSDWGKGTTIDCKLMVEGVGQVWQEDDIFTVYKLEGIFELSSVTPNVNGVITDKVQAGETISAKVIWKNVGTAAIAPRFRWDLRRSGIATWNEGPWVTSPSVAPGATGTVNPYCKVPSDWGKGTTIDCKLMVEGVGQVWQKDDIFTVYKLEGIFELSSVTPNVNGVITDKVQPGETISAKVIWKNVGTAAIAPRFRWDLRRSGIATWNEGPWVTSPSVAPGATGTVNPYCKVPSDWGEGTTIDCKLMVEGVGQVWQRDDIFTVYKPVGKVSISSVTPNVNGVITDKVQPGDTISAKVIWKNVGTAAIAPRFRWDLRRSGWATWNEGPWVTSPSVAPGATGTVNPYCKVPSDWGEGTTIDCKLMVEGVGQVWQRDDIFTVYKKVLVGPNVETLIATNICGDSADLNCRLVSSGTHEEARCHFDWGKTMSYGYKTPYVMLRSGDELTVKLASLNPDTLYHFRAVASTSLGTDYGDNRYFRTKSVVTAGFRMRQINLPSGATQWSAGCVQGYPLPYMKFLEPPDYIWVWNEMVPEYVVHFFVYAAGPWQDGFAPTIRSYRFYFRLRNEKRYVWDWDAYYPEIPDLALMMKEE